MADKLVIVAQFSNYIEAELAKQLLADYQVKAVVTGQHASSLYSIPAMGRSDLMVLESQAEEARQILELQKRASDAATDNAMEQ